MNADATNKVNNADTNAALSISNPWIVCRSKSHGGHVYYFNTLTGEAAWNLSDVEIEKAKNATKLLRNKLPPRTWSPDFSTMNFRQGPVNPQNSVQNDSDPKLLFSSFMNNTPFSGTPNNLLSVPNNLLGAPINPINVNNMHSMYNPSIWAVPPSQQIFISSSPIANTSQGPLNVAYNNMQQNLSANNIAASIFNNLDVNNHVKSNLPTQNNFSTNNDFFSARETNEINRSLIKRNYTVSNQNSSRWRGSFKRNNFFQDRQVYKRNVPDDSKSSDLRQKLGYRRKLTNNAGSPSEGYHFNSNRFNNFNTTSTIGQNSADFGTNFKQSQDLMYEDSSFRLDLTPLKELAGSNVNTDSWFIVVDAKIILNEFKFLITLTDSDPHCHLMIPRSVMSELESYVSNSDDMPARRIVRYLTQQIRVGHVRIGELSDDVDGEPTNAVLSTCSSLLKGDYHQIIITSDNNLIRNKHSINIKIFTVDELKTLLKPIRTEFHDTKSPTFIPKVLKKKIVTTSGNTELRTITITNQNVRENNDVLVNKSDAKGEPISNLIQKRTVDAGIQTDFTDSKDVSENAITIDDQQNPKAKNPVDCAKESTVELKTITNIPPKRRSIRLKRTISHPQTLPSQSNKKKTFKWRIKRNISANETSTSTSIPKDMDTIDLEIQSTSCKDDIDIADHEIVSQDHAATNTDISDISVPRQTLEKNVIIEETSTSGIISNSLSNNDAESISYGVTASKRLNMDESKLEPTRNDMFTVESNMHEYLETKCDEWVSRFTQIMEEVLSQVLQQDPQFLHKTLPPPWTLHEAAQCIFLRFNNHNAIKVAANKLSNILFQVSDDKGKITLSMTPSQYMEMYSYGVHLVDALKMVVTELEDLHIATKSLKELLYDIQHPNLNTSTQESFNDVLLEEGTPDVTSIEESISPMRDITSTKTLLSTPSSSKSKQSKYNLRSQNQMFIRDNEDSAHNVESAKTGKCQFFSTLNLQRKDDGDLPKNYEIALNNRQPEKALESCNSFMFNKINFKRTLENKTCNPIDNVNISNTLPINLEIHEKDNDTSKNDIETVNATKEPKIIRNFGRCIEFEKKLFKKYEDELKTQFTEHFNEDLDYEEDYSTEEYAEDQEYDDIIGDMDVAEGSDDELNIPEPGDSECSESNYAVARAESVDDNAHVTPKPIESDANNNDINKFKFIIGKVVEEIKEAFHPVQILCETYYNECKRPNGFKIKKIQLQAKAKKAQWHIENITDALESMLGREMSDSNEDMTSLMKKAGIEHIGENLHKEYKYTISKCKSHAEIYLDALKTMISELGR